MWRQKIRTSYAHNFLRKELCNALFYAKKKRKEKEAIVFQRCIDAKEVDCICTDQPMQNLNVCRTQLLTNKSINIVDSSVFFSI